MENTFLNGLDMEGLSSCFYSTFLRLNLLSKRISSVKQMVHKTSLLAFEPTSPDINEGVRSYLALFSMYMCFLLGTVGGGR